MNIAEVNPYDIALLIDVVLVLICFGLLLRFGRLSHSHPATIYGIFHLHTVTVRLLGLRSGAPTLYSDYFFELYLPVRPAEIVRAALLFDLALVIMTVVWLWVAQRDIQRSRQAQPALPLALPLARHHLHAVALVAFPMGVIGILLMARLPGRDASNIYLGIWRNSSWLLMLQLWSGLALLALMYWHGLRWWLLVPMVLYLLIMGYQGYHRFRVIIPALMLTQIYLDRRGRRWPSLKVTAFVVGLALLFFPLKTIGSLAQQGANPSEIVAVIGESIAQVLSGKAGDQQFMDQFASALTLTDDHGKVYYGSTHLALLTLPVPRQWWPEKPGLADFMRDISRPWRPMAEMGMIVTFLGEAYINFRYVGVVLIPALLAYWLGRAYFAAYRSGYLSVQRFAYLLVATNLIQVFRDGLSSLLVFTMVNMMPLTLIVLLHILFPPRSRRQPEALPVATR